MRASICCPPDRAELAQLAISARDQLEQAWSLNSAHYSVDYEGQPHASAGQCYVSSMALAKVFRSHYEDLLVEVCRGRLHRNGRELIADHGWLEVSWPGGSCLFDITIDQAGVPYRAVIGSGDELRARKGFYYDVVDRRSLCDIDNHDAWVRYWILEATVVNVVASASLWDGLGVWEQV